MTVNPLDNIKKRQPPERRTFPDPAYEQSVLQPVALEARRLLQGAAIQVQRARIVDLVEIRTIERPDAIAALDVLSSLDSSETSLHHPLEHLDSALARVGGAALLASAPEEVAAAAMRVVLREWALDLMEAVIETREALTKLAQGHLTTMLTVTSNGQMVQPTTLGHYLTGQLGPLVRTTGRLREVYSRVNRSPIGSVSGMATAVPMRRERVSGLLGFDGMIDHTLDALAAGDIEYELMSIVAASSIETLRVIADMTEWARDDIGIIAPGDEFIHQGSSQPQRRDPMVLDHLRLRFTAHISEMNALSSVLTGRSMVAGTATRYDVFFRVQTGLASAASDYRLLNRVVGTLEVNRALAANRSHRGFATSSELADLLAVDCGLGRSEAYALAERIATEATILGLGGMTLDTKLVDKLALEVVGREVGIEPETLGKCLSVKRFVERREVLGGPAPAAVNDAIERETLSARRDRSWIGERRDVLKSAGVSLDELVGTVLSGGAPNPSR